MSGAREIGALVYAADSGNVIRLRNGGGRQDRP
jgi:hypothetical protein